MKSPQVAPELINEREFADAGGSIAVNR